MIRPHTCPRPNCSHARKVRRTLGASRIFNYIYIYIYIYISAAPDFPALVHELPCQVLGAILGTMQNLTT